MLEAGDHEFAGALAPGDAVFGDAARRQRFRIHEGTIHGGTVRLQDAPIAPDHGLQRHRFRRAERAIGAATPPGRPAMQRLAGRKPAVQQIGEQGRIDRAVQTKVARALAAPAAGADAVTIIVIGRFVIARGRTTAFYIR